MRTTPYHPVIVAHRGLHGSGDLPENSVPAFRAARRNGFVWVECDVWSSADGVPIVHHDETLDRKSEAAGPLAGRTSEALRRIRLLDSFGRAHESTVPRLADVFADDPGMAVLVEVKPPDDRALVRAVWETMRAHSGEWVLQSFDAANLAHATAIDASLPAAFLVEDREGLERGIAAGFKRISMDHALLDVRTAQRLRDRGITIGVWTPTDPVDLRRVIDLRADWIITDDPVMARQLLAETRAA